MRARQPDRQDFVERNGIKVGFEVHDGGQPALLLVPAAPITHGRSWKMIAPSLAGRFTVARSSTGEVPVVLTARRRRSRTHPTKSSLT